MMRFPALLLVCAVSAGAFAQAPAAEQGTFVLHKFAKEIGKETYSVQRADGKQTLTSEFLFTDRGSKVPLKTEYVASATGEPISLKVDGKSSRIAELKDELTLDTAAHAVKVVQSGKERSSAAGPGTFLIDGYSPVAMQEMLMRFWLAHGKPAVIPTPIMGDVRITPAGELSVAGPGGQVKLQGYVVNGLIWGGETLWMDAQKNLVALVSTDAEFDHFEAIRDGYEAQLGVFISTAAKNGLAALAVLAKNSKQPQAKRLLIANVTLIDGTGAPVMKSANVLVENGVITKIVRADRMDTKNTTVIDGSGKFLIPGLWDMHAHYEQVEWGPIYLAAGVTTVRDCGNEFDFITTVRDTLDAGKGIGPKLLMAGIVDGPGPISLGAVTADTPEEAVAVVRKYKAAGALQIKIYSSMKPALVPVITAEAHRLGMTVTGHVPTGMTSVQAVEAGYDQINHVQYPIAEFTAPNQVRTGPVMPLDFTTDRAKHAIEVFKQHATVLDDTVALFEWDYHAPAVSVDSFEPGVDKVAPQLWAAEHTEGMPASQAARLALLLPNMYDVVRHWHEWGLPVVAGTDQAVPGYSLHRELELYVEKAGFTPMEALQAGTSVPAKVMGLDKTLGTIEVGKRADMVLLDGDPLADIHNTRKIVKTIANGAVYEPAPLWVSVGFKP